jgi:NAD(P) transhydrogenase subunit alpha
MRMTIIAALKETKSGESRAAISVDTVKKYIALGFTVRVEAGAGEASNITDAVLKDAGAELVNTASAAVKDADIVLCANLPDASVLSAMKEGASLIGSLAPYSDKAALGALNNAKLNGFALELLPRISRAQAMDVLSSQSNLAGFRAVIEAVSISSKITAMMMTAAGTVPPAKALVLGAGVAGLQAIATAKRLGAVVSAFDVRAATKEQVMSLGAKFIDVPAEENLETSGGYAKEMSDSYKERQNQAIFDAIRTQDIVISTALIPGKQAPELITEAMLEAMKPGSVIVDMAAASGGNCRLTTLDAVTNVHGVTLVGYSNLASRAAHDATPLYARNLYHFVSTLMVNKEKAFAIDWEDELIKGTLITKDGGFVHPLLAA